MSSVLTPTFWVAVSFFIFIILAWKHLRAAFLNIINAYRNSISATILNIENQKEQSAQTLENSEKELLNTKSNDAILNAHKLAKEILVKSEVNVKKIQTTGMENANSATEAFKSSMLEKAKRQILQKTAIIVEAYISKNQKQFNKISIEKVNQTLKNAKR